MSKIDDMRQGIAQYVDESIGKREGTGQAAPLRPAGNAFAGRTQHRNACFIQLDSLIPDPDQPRKTFTQEDLEQLAHSLKTKGQLQPIRVRYDEGRGVYVILMGERRWRAAKMAGLGQLECVVHDGPLADDEIFEIQLIENAIRQDLTPIEQAQAFQKLLDKKGWSLSRLADELHMNKSTISRSLSLLTLPDDIRQAIASGQVPATVGREVAKLDDPARQREMVERFLQDGLTTDDTAAAVSASKGRAKSGVAAGNGTKKTITLPSGLKITVTARKKHSTADIVDGLRQCIVILESDGRTRRKAG